MAYITTKKIFPGNYNEALNGWYQNIPNVAAPQAPGSLASNAGPTAVLACPGWRYFQFMGYVAITGGSANATTQAQVIVPSPYQNDATRPLMTTAKPTSTAPLFPFPPVGTVAPLPVSSPPPLPTF